MLHPFGIFCAVLGHALRQFDEQPHRQHAEHQQEVIIVILGGLETQRPKAG